MKTQATKDFIAQLRPLITENETHELMGIVYMPQMNPIVKELQELTKGMNQHEAHNAIDDHIAEHRNNYNPHKLMTAKIMVLDNIS